MWPFWVTHALYVSSINSLVSGCLGFNSTLACDCALLEVKGRNFTNSVRKTTSQNLEHCASYFTRTLLWEYKGDCEDEGHLSPGAQQSLYEQLRAYLEVSFLRGSLAADPGAHLGQFLLLCRRELGLPLFHAAELCQVSPQHLFSSPKHSKGL